MDFIRILALLLLLPFGVSAQDPDPRLEELLDRAELKAEAGREREALEYLKHAMAIQGDDLEVLRLAIDIAINTGDYASADSWSEALIEQNEGTTRGDLILRARLLARLSRVKESLDILKPLLETRKEKPTDRPGIDFEATAFAGRLHASRGRDKEAEELFDSLVQEAKRVVLRDVSDLVALSHAYVFFGGPTEAERALVEARRRDPEQIQAFMALGDLYRSYAFQLPRDSTKQYRRAIEVRKGWAEAHVGMGRAYELWSMEPKALNSYKRALRINPSQPEALAAMARLHIVKRQHAEAERMIRKALEVDPQHREALTLQASMNLVRSDTEAFEKILKKVLEIDPTWSRAYRIAGGIMDRYWRWPEALKLLRRAVKISPKDPAIHDDLAKYAFYLGLEEEGTLALKTTDGLSRYGAIWRGNMWIIQRKIRKQYKVIESQHFIHRVHKSEEAGLGSYLAEFSENSYRILSEKYRYEPEGLQSNPRRILVEHFNKHDDFAVRTLGLKGLGIQGVCFGPFIAQDSPGAGIPGFNWYRTLHHEITHCMTLGISKGRLPRWFTEGLSTLEEVSFNPSWDRRMDRELFDALETDDLLSVLSFDAAFQTPRVLFAYFQAGVVCKMISEEFGHDSILRMLKAYGEGRSTADVFKVALKVEPSEIDARFKKYVGKRTAPIRLIPRLAQKKFKQLEIKADSADADIESVVLVASALVDRGKVLDAQELVHKGRKLASDDPRLDFIEGRIALGSKRISTAREHFEKAASKGYENHDMHLMLARLYEKAGEEKEAEASYRKALATYPARHDKEDPRLALARLAQGAGKVDEAISWQEKHLELAFEDMKVRKKLASWYFGREDHENAARHLKALILLAPQEPQIHLQLGAALLALADADGAVQELRVAVGVSVKDAAKVDAMVKLAKALWKGMKDVDGAREVLDAAVDIIPDHVGTQKLLKELNRNRRK